MEFTTLKASYNKSLLSIKVLFNLKTKKNIMKNKELWKTVIQFAISILTAALTAMSTTSCMGHGPIYM